MSRKAKCRDSAFAESLFISLKKERIKKHSYTTCELAITDLADYVESFYNPVRRHSHLGGISPDRF